jgi:hypothetical protein
MKSSDGMKDRLMPYERLVPSPRGDLTQVKCATRYRLDAAQCLPAYDGVSFKKHKSEAVMAELSTLDTPAVAIDLLSTTDAVARFSSAHKNALEFMFGAQKMLLEEMVFVGNELVDRTRTETHLLSEFVSKVAESHSVSDLRTMFEECSRRQIDFLRRDSERLFRHSQRMIETASNLLANRPQP